MHTFPSDGFLAGGAIKSDSNSLNGLKLEFDQYPRREKVVKLVEACETYLATAWTRHMPFSIFVSCCALTHDARMPLVRPNFMHENCFTHAGFFCMCQRLVPCDERTLLNFLSIRSHPTEAPCRPQTPCIGLQPIPSQPAGVATSMMRRTGRT